MDLSQVVFSGVRPFITPVSVTAQAENRAGAIHLKADVAFDFRCPVTAVRRKHRGHTGFRFSMFW